MTRFLIRHRYAMLACAAALLIVAAPASARRKNKSESPPPAQPTQAQPAPAAADSQAASAKAAPTSSAPPASAQPAPTSAPQAIAQPAPAAAQGAAPATAAAGAAATPPPSAQVPALSDSARAAIREEIARQLKQMADTLELTQAQREKVRPILLDQAYQLRQIRLKYTSMERTPANREAMTKEVQTLRTGSDAKLGQVLTANQMDAYKKWREEMVGKARTKLGAPDTTSAK